MSSYGVVSTANAPVLKRVTKADLISFDTDYEAYKEKISDVNRNRDASRQIDPASIRQCMEPTLLHSLCILGQIDNATELSQATDAAVKKWFEDRLATNPEDLTERVRSALDSVKYKVDNTDPSGAALTFIIDVVTALDKNNASEVIKDKDPCKSLISKLVSKLEPAELRERIWDARGCWTGVQRSDLSLFQSRVSVAVEVAQGEMARNRIQRRGKKRDRPEGPDKRPGKNKNPEYIKGQPSSSKPGKKTPTDGKGQSVKSSTWDTPCLNPDCPEIHPLSQCKNTNEERKTDLFEQYRAETRKKVAHGKMNALKIKDEMLPSAPDESSGRYRVLLEENVPTVALGDYGADESAIPRQIFDDLVKREIDLLVTTVNPAYELTTAISGSSESPVIFTASRK